MKKSIVLFFAAFLTISAFAQSVQEGVGHLYAERYTSAKNTFEKMLSSNPNNLEAAYWLGQTHIANGNVAAAKQVYDKALASNGNAPMIMVGMGHVELIEGKTAEARQRFETAISLSRGKKGDDPMVLNAIGRANVESKTGDIQYAIAKLNAAAQLQPVNPDILINLGNAYRKAKDGGQAATNYLKAAPYNAALANYRLARLYETQRNWEIFNEHLNKAIAADAKFAPALSSQYYYNLLYKKDFAAAEAIAQKLIAASDQSIQNDFFSAQTKYLQKNYNDAITIGKNIISQSGEQVNPRVYRMLGYSYLELGDTAAALQYVDELFAKAKDEDFVPQDYVLKATAYSKTKTEMVVDIYLNAAAEDTTLRNKLILLQEGIEWAQKNKMKIPEADLRLALSKLNPNANPAALFQIGLPYYQAKSYEKADSVFKAYTAAFPDSVYGHYWSANSLAALDAGMEKGLAVPGYEKTLELAATDKVRFKSMGIQASGYLATYYNNIKKDKTTAITFLQKGLEFDPTNTSLQNTLKILQGNKSTGTKAAATNATSSKTTIDPAGQKKG